MFNNEIIIKLYSIIFRILFKYKFASFGTNSKIVYPLKIEGHKNIQIGNYVRIGYKTWISALPLTSEPKVSLVIGDNTCIGNFNHIICTKSIHIGKKVLIADKVYISDNIHEYSDINTAILDQGIRQIAGVKIGDGTWIGENACVIGVEIGKNCVIGANAVVTKDIPDYSVAVGVPAKLIKRYNFSAKKWELL
jgi:acetyltransferase-like isoleucine patch superfamily enzyme